jgi:hypothetical protein
VDNVDNSGSEQFCSVSFCTKPNNARHRTAGLGVAGTALRTFYSDETQRSLGLPERLIPLVVEGPGGAGGPGP